MNDDQLVEETLEIFKAAIPGETGRSGLNVQGGRIREEFLPQLRDGKALSTFKEMSRNDPTASGMLFAVEMFARQPDWFFIPPDVDELTDADHENTDFANSWIDDMSHTWQELMSEALTMLPFGFSPFEIIYKRRLGPGSSGESRSRFNDGRIGWRKFAIRAQETVDKWLFDESGGVQGFVQFVGHEGFRVKLPIEKLVIFRLRPHKNNPEGQSILRGAWRAWMIKKRIEEIEAVGIERDLQGIPVVYLPGEWMGPNATDPQKAAVKKYEDLVARVRANELTGLVLPTIIDKATGQKMLEFELLTTGSRRAHDTDTIIQRWDTRMALSIQAQFMTTGLSQQGSFALASSQTHVFAIAIGAILDSFQETLQRHAVPKLWALNGLPMDRIPRLRHSDIETPDIRDVGNLLLRLSDSGFPVQQAPGLMEQILRMAGLETAVAGPEFGVLPETDGGDAGDSSTNAEGRSPQASADNGRRGQRSRGRNASSSTS